MTKAPLAGSSKTRLTPPLTPHEAAELSACFLRDTCENIASVCLDGTAAGVAVYTPTGAEKLFDGLLPDSFTRVRQRGNSIEERLIHAADDLMSLGYDSFCLIGADTPTLPPAFLRAAVSAVARPEDQLVLGPATDGGYYLIGLKKMHRCVFEEVDWSTSRVLAQTIARANQISVPQKLLPAWFDVDDQATLRQLCDELFCKNDQSLRQADPVAYPAPYTRAYLSQLLKAHPSRFANYFDRTMRTGRDGC